MSFYRSITTSSLLAIVSFFALGGAVALAANASTDTAASPSGPTPNAALSPEQVVRIQLEALRANDAADNGIEVCFRFASPKNQANTGPLTRFGRMIKDGVYALMLDYENAEYQPVEVVDRFARQKVTLVGSSKIVTYVFYLSKQTHEACPECWMTDSVAVEQILEST